ncbi:MAG: hypothetical protein ACLGIN_12265 [Candidatus Sericytochromatia bacterium]
MKLPLPRLALLACLTFATALPCEASPESASPELAAGLAIGAPLGLMAISRLSPDPLVLIALPALGLGMGHLYAGRPLRGGVVALGSTVAGIGVFNLLRPAEPAGGGPLQAAIVAGAAVALALAAQDAYVVAEAGSLSGEELGVVAQEEAEQ